MILIASKADEAGMNIAQHLEKKGINVIFTKVHPVYLNYFERIIEIPEGETAVFLSRHSSARGVKSLTIHSAGNFSTNDLGGEKNYLTYTDPFLMHSILLNLHKLNDTDYNVTYEATHHGPASNQRLIFVEIGSTEKEYVDEHAGELVAEAIMNASPLKDKSYCGIGGPHYSEKFTRLAIERGIKFGHIASKYRFNELTDDILKQMYEKTEKCDGFLIDEKSFNSNQKRELEEKLGKLNLKYDFV